MSAGDMNKDDTPMRKNNKKGGNKKRRSGRLSLTQTNLALQNTKQKLKKDDSSGSLNSFVKEKPTLNQ